MTFSTDTIESLIDKETLRFKIGEGDLEFKQEFNISKLYKIIVAMSNCNGGIIVYGVDDNGFITGLKNEDAIPDNSIISRFCQTHFSETIRFETCRYDITDRIIYAFKIYQIPTPLYAVCVKDAEGIFDGDIYIRLSGITEKIKGHVLSRYLHKIHQKAEGDLSQLQKKALIAQYQPRFKSGVGCGSSGTEIKLVIRNEGATATLLKICSNSTEINIYFNESLNFRNGDERYLNIRNGTSKPGAQIVFDLTLEYSDELDNIYQQIVKCTGGAMRFETPSIINK
ncbi:MAG: ATP-binding protein [Bacteroidia bacterium]